MSKNYYLGLGTAFLAWLAWPPIPYTSILLLVAFVPLLVAVENIIGNTNAKRKGKKIFALSFFTFAIWNTSCIYWVFNSVNSIMPVPIALLISLIPFGLAALLMAIAFWLYYRLRLVSGKVWSYLGLISFWLGYEFLHQTWDLNFPWMTLGNGFANFHQIIQWYEFTGVYGGSLWIWVCNILVFEMGLRFLKESKLQTLSKKLIVGSGLVILLPICISVVRYSTYKEKINPVNIVVVQPNIDPYLKFTSLPSSSQIQTLVNLSDSVGQTNTEYFLWPETAISEDTDEKTIHSSNSFQQVQSFLKKYPNANVISGLSGYLLYDSAITPTARYIKKSNIYYDSFNTAVQIENSAKVQFYHKSRLVPGVEQMPFPLIMGFLKPLFAGFGGTTGSYGSQKEPSVFFSQSGIGAAPVICYESIWGEYVSDYVNKGAQFIAIITNDAWWGDTSGKDQHLDYARLRSIETRRWVARSANTGISGFINQRGDITKRSSWWKATALKENINLNDQLTFYTKHGDYIVYTACLMSIGFIFFLLLRITKRPQKTIS